MMCIPIFKIVIGSKFSGRFDTASNTFARYLTLTVHRPVLLYGHDSAMGQVSSLHSGTASHIAIGTSSSLPLLIPRFPNFLLKSVLRDVKVWLLFEEKCYGFL